MILVDWSQLKYFSRQTDPKLACYCCHRCDLDHDFMIALDALREAVGFPLRINSGYRCQQWDRQVGGAGVHPQGIAVDIPVAGEQAYNLVGAAMVMGFTGIGVRQHGLGRFVHLDMLDADHRPRIWSYT